MPIVTTDDQARRLRNVWLGGKGFDWPVAARYSAWGLFVGLFVLGSLLAWAALPPLAFFLAGLPGALLLALLLARAVMRHVTAERTVRSHILTLQAELRAPRPRDQLHEFTVQLTPALLQENPPR